MRTKVKTITAAALLVVMMATMLVPIASAETIGIAPCNVYYKTIERPANDLDFVFVDSNGPASIIVRGAAYTEGLLVASLLVPNYYGDVTVAVTGYSSNNGTYWATIYGNPTASCSVTYTSPKKGARFEITATVYSNSSMTAPLYVYFITVNIV